jgi:hypothetical protein
VSSQTTISEKTAETEVIKPDYKEQFEAVYARLQIAEPSERQEKQPLVLAHYMHGSKSMAFIGGKGVQNLILLKCFQMDG